MTKTELARNPEAVKGQLVQLVSSAVDDLTRAALEEGRSPRELERGVWPLVLALGRIMVAYAFTLRCLRSVQADLDERGLKMADVRFRCDPGYRAALTTTFGPVMVETCAYREATGFRSSTTRSPARRDVLPSYDKCRSSELLLEWEARLAKELPYRQAQVAMAFFTHEAVQLEDTTIARHAVAIGSCISRDWLYRTPEDIAQTLRLHATRDRESGRPIVFASTDAHFLRRYVDAGWLAEWKASNGVRLWCIDRDTGAIIHLGGEYTWGDCTEVQRIFEWLIASGRLPHDGRYPEVHAQVVLVTDGMPWIEERIANLFGDAYSILDAYHLLEHIAAYAALVHGKATAAARALYRAASKVLFGDRGPHTKKATQASRKKHTKTKRVSGPASPFDPPPRHQLLTATRLVQVLKDDRPTPQDAALHKLIEYIYDNALRIDYEWFKGVGYQIGSGAMEALHRNGSQMRVKRPGARWLQETSQAILNLRMLELSGRWTEFWSQSNLTETFGAALAANAKVAP